MSDQEKGRERRKIFFFQFFCFVVAVFFSNFSSVFFLTNPIFYYKYKCVFMYKLMEINERETITREKSTEKKRIILTLEHKKIFIFLTFLKSQLFDLETQKKLIFFPSPMSIFNTIHFKRNVVLSEW